MTKSIGHCRYDNSIAVVELHDNEEDRRKYIVVDITKIACQVRLIVAPREEKIYIKLLPLSLCFYNIYRLTLVFIFLYQ
jgi:hypothetical protein